MYGAAGVAGLGAAAYGAKRLLGSNAVATEPEVERVSDLNAEENAKLAEAQEYLTKIGDIAKQHPADKNLKTFHGQMTKAILMVAATDQTPKSRRERQIELKNLMDKGKIEFSRTGERYPVYYAAIAASLGALVLIGIGSWTGYYSVAPTVKTVGTSYFESFPGIASLTTEAVKNAFKFLPSWNSWGLGSYISDSEYERTAN
jgi:hypothetical protein